MNVSARRSRRPGEAGALADPDDADGSEAAAGDRGPAGEAGAGGAGGRRAEARPRLVVELTRATGAQLDELVEVEELNKTTIVNRALQVYHFLRTAERDGAQVLLLDTGDAVPQRIRFL